VPLTISFLVLVAACAYATEPQGPVVDTIFATKTEVAINELAALSTSRAFERLRDIKYLVNEKKLNKAVFKAFKQRKKEAIDRAIKSLSSPVEEVIANKVVNRSVDFYIARKILQVFPDDAVNSLLDSYESGDAITRGNIIRASGKMATAEIRDLLLMALDDTSFVEETYPENMGEPMRICDLAYNQLVLRYRIKDVLRSIGPVYRIENRDYHINILKKVLKKVFED
jgi:hypothetical protein